MPDRYEIETHYYPALLNSLPFLLLGYYFFSHIDSEFWKQAAAVTIGSIGIVGALYWLEMSLCRALGKFIEDKLYSSGSKMPTTELMLIKDNRMTQRRKTAITTKVKSDFNIELENNLEDTRNNRILINEAVGQIRTKIGRNNPLVSQRNRQYGFFRNTLGGAVLALLASLAGVLISVVTGNDVAHEMSLLFTILYASGIVVLFPLLKFMGNQYAIALYDEYLASD